MADLDVTPPIEVDPDALAQDALDYMADQIPGFDPAAGTLVRFLLEATARIGAEGAELASAALDNVFRSFGPLVGVEPLEETAASITSTWTLSDDAGHTIVQGTLVEIQGDAESAAFEVQDDVTVAPGSTVTGAGEVVLNAVVEGAAGSGLAGPAELIDALDFVEAIALTGITAGGRDEEPTEDFNLRLADELRLLTPRPIVPHDFATLVQNRVAGIERAMALDTYNPATSTFGNERMVAVAVHGPDGLAASTTAKAEADALLQLEREATFVVNIIDPTYTSIGVTFTAVALPDAVPSQVEAQAEAAVADYLSPANWGRPFGGGLTESGITWFNTPIVRYLEVAAALDRVEGLDYVTALTVEGGTADVNLAGAAALPVAGTIAGTVTAAP